MSWTVRVRPEAELDLLVAAGWYESRRKELAAEFLEELSGVIASLADNALLYETLFGEVRRVIARRFPYSVTYQIVGNDVIVMSVLHMRRNPNP